MGTDSRRRRRQTENYTYRLQLRPVGGGGEGSIFLRRQSVKNENFDGLEKKKKKIFRPKCSRFRKKFAYRPSEPEVMDVVDGDGKQRVKRDRFFFS